MDSVLTPGLENQKKCCFPLHRGVPSKEVIDTKTMWTFFRDQILFPVNCSLVRDVPKASFNCNIKVAIIG